MFLTHAKNIYIYVYLLWPIIFETSFKGRLMDIDSIITINFLAFFVYSQKLYYMVIIKAVYTRYPSKFGPFKKKNNLIL